MSFCYILEESSQPNLYVNNDTLNYAIDRECNGLLDLDTRED